MAPDRDGRDRTPWSTVRVWPGSARPGRCKDCRRPIVWVITEKGKYLPFDLGFSVRETVVRPDRLQFLVLDREDRHACQERKDRRKQQRAARP